MPLRYVPIEEADLIAGLNPKGTLIVNGDDDKILHLVGSFPGKTITFGLAPDNDLVASDIECTEAGVRFRFTGDRDERDVFVPMLGKHVACNALAAIAVAREMNLSDDDIIAALAQAHGPDMRLQLEKINGLTLLSDAYNANPASMKAALETVCALPISRRGRRIAIVGDMRELGAHTERYHREAGEFAASQTNLDVLICVGPNARLIAEAARAAGMPATSIRQYDDIASAARSVPKTLKKGDLVLFKASRSLQLETVVKAVQEKKASKLAS